jgi:hypothetical protein
VWFSRYPVDSKGAELVFLQTDQPDPTDRAGRIIDRGDRTETTRDLALAALPAVLVGLLIRVWLLRSPLLAMNADEALTGLQGFEVLHGSFRLVVAGNDYGSTTESYLIAPLLLVWTGVWPLRIVFLVLSVSAAYTVFRLARPFYGPAPALAVALIGWSISGAVVLIWSRSYMGYPTGFIAQVMTLALACHAMRTSRRLSCTAAGAGLAAGFAIWSHPMFGAVAMLALLVPSLYRRRQVRTWWLPLAAGGVVGVSPWLVHMTEHGWPESAYATYQVTYPERIRNFVTELLPRAFGLRSPDGVWLTPSALAITAAAVLILGAVGGLLLLVIYTGAPAVPLLIAGLLAFPCLALFAPLGFFRDARYSLPFLPQLLVGLGAWVLLLPARLRDSPWLPAIVPTVWVILLCVPVLHLQTGWQTDDPDRAAERVVYELRNRDLRYLGGDYWGTYLIDYLADGDMAAKADYPTRLAGEAGQVDSADPAKVAFIYLTGQKPALKLPKDQYQMVTVGPYDLYLPVPRRGR